jgi:hypothetical protein
MNAGLDIIVESNCQNRTGAACWSAATHRFKVATCE